VPSAALYSRPRCACLACSDLSYQQGAPADDHGGLYRQPTTAMWRDGDHADVYYNSNEVDMDHPHRYCGCFGGQARSTAGRQCGRPLMQGGPLTTPTCMLQPPLISRPSYNVASVGRLSVTYVLWLNDAS